MNILKITMAKTITKLLKFSNRSLFAATILLAACGKPAPASVEENVYYTCSMDPQVVEQKPGPCPICKMPLVRVEVAHDKKDNELKLSAEQIRLANIQTDTVRLLPLGEEISLAATLRENQNGINTVTARLTGRLERLFVRNIGEYVRAGQAVFELYSEDLAAAQQDYLLALKSKNRYGSTNLDFSRIAEAARNKLLLWGMAEAQLQEIEQSGAPKNTVTFHSRYAGFVMEAPPAEGSYVAEGSTVLKLADLRTLWAEAQLYVSDLPFLAQSREASVTLPYFPGRILSGKVSFVNPNLEAASKIVLTRVEISNPGCEYQPGMQAWITLKGKTRRTLAVPTNALIRESRGTTVWIKNANGGFEGRMVRIGIANEDYTEIVEGLQSGEIVVVSGAYLLNSEFVFKKGSDPMAGHKM
ncbi:MAG: efflux RND transporter periplasmic adaptor subunit [Haliscomenobacteraceae bacterium CHB4]|nr:efflux RND transporter periplasmic adaptor subunit [Haliscomenobacteraceae bacterium CHB4]